MFDRFPDLRVAFIETQLFFMIAAIAHLDATLSWSDDWMAFARFMKRERTCTRLASEYVATNCFIGVSPFWWGPSYVYAPPPVYSQPAPWGYWYYCPSARAYYPYVQSCPESWVAVPAR